MDSGVLRLADWVLGPPSLDDLPGRSRALQDAACGIPQVRLRMGNSWRSRSAAPSQGGRQRSIPAGVGHTAVFDQTMGKVARNVRGGGRLDTYTASVDTGGCVPVRGVL